MLEHPGRADSGRIPSSICAKLLMPGVNPLTFAIDQAASAAAVALTGATYPYVPAEPPLRC